MSKITQELLTRIVKFAANIGYDYLYSVREIQHSHAYHSPYLSFFFSNKCFVTHFSATASLRSFKFSTNSKKGMRKVQGVPQSQTAALPSKKRELAPSYLSFSIFVQDFHQQIITDGTFFAHLSHAVLREICIYRIMVQYTSDSYGWVGAGGGGEGRGRERGRCVSFAHYLLYFLSNLNNVEHN